MGGEGEKEQEEKRSGGKKTKTSKSLGKYLEMRMVPILQPTGCEIITLLTSMGVLPLALAKAGFHP